MNCPVCKNNLIWNSDFDYDDDDSEEYVSYSFWTCTPCHVEVIVNHPK